MHEQVTFEFHLQIYPRWGVIPHDRPTKGLKCAVRKDPSGCCFPLPTGHWSIGGHAPSKNQLKVVQRLEQEDVEVVARSRRSDQLGVREDVDLRMSVRQNLIHQPTLIRALEPLVPVIQNQDGPLAGSRTDLLDMVWKLHVDRVVSTKLDPANSSTSSIASLLLLLPELAIHWCLIGVIHQIASCLSCWSWGLRRLTTTTTFPCRSILRDVLDTFRSAGGSGNSSSVSGSAAADDWTVFQDNTELVSSSRPRAGGNLDCPANSCCCLSRAFGMINPQALERRQKVLRQSLERTKIFRGLITPTLAKMAYESKKGVQWSCQSKYSSYTLPTKPTYENALEFVLSETAAARLTASSPEISTMSKSAAGPYWPDLKAVNPHVL